MKEETWQSLFQTCKNQEQRNNLLMLKEAWQRMASFSSFNSQALFAKSR